MNISVGELAVRYGCALQGDPQVRVDHVGSLGAGGGGALSFLANARLAPQLAATRAAAVVLEPGSAALCPVAALITANPHAVFARIATLLHPTPPLSAGIHPSAVLDPGARIDPSAHIGALAVIGAEVLIGPRCFIGPGCVIAEQVQIGADSRLLAGVTLAAGVRIGERALLHPGGVIGADGFGFARDEGRWLRVPQVGAVLIGDDVEIGANTTIDRGAIEDTVIADGVKLDNQIQVGHNVRIGAHTAIAGCTGISGSTRIGERCMIGGGVRIAGHIEICDDVVITGMTTVTRSLTQPGVYASVIPAEPLRRWKRIVGRLKLLERKTADDARGADDE